MVSPYKVMWSFWCFLGVGMNKLLNKKWSCQWFETTMMFMYWIGKESLYINSLRPSDAYVRQESNHHWFRQRLVAWTAPSHYLNQCWNIVHWTLRNKLQWNLNRNSYIFIHENAFENVVWKMAAILSRPQSVNFLCFTIISNPWVFYCEYMGHEVNSLALGRFERNFRWIIFKLILMMDSSDISCKNVLSRLSLDLTNDKSTLLLRHRAITWAIVDPVLRCHMASVGQNELSILILCV